MKRTASMMHVQTPTGSHLPTLITELEKLPEGALVIEHGAGLYSTPLFCQFPMRVLCAESHDGWLDWARWMYTCADTTVEFVASWKRLVPRLPEAALIFIDGAARERGDLLRCAIEQRVPVIVQHDTQPETWHDYRLHGHDFTARGYDVTHDDQPQRTTTWRLKSS